MTITSRKQYLGAEPEVPVSSWAKWAPLAVIMCGTFVFILDR